MILESQAIDRYWKRTGDADTEDTTPGATATSGATSDRQILETQDETTNTGAMNNR